jgi:hypothetical protein
VILNLARLGTMHPALRDAKEAEGYQRRAALALEREKHVPNVRARIANGVDVATARLRWKPLEDAAALKKVVDANRVTEDGAEGVALAFVHAVGGWTVERRVQRGESADWLLVDSIGGRRMLLEVSGTSTPDVEARLATKLRQVAGVSERGYVLAAIVVGFIEPRVLAATVDGGGVS